MADSHDNEDPNAAPMRQYIDENFSEFQVGAAWVLGIVALALGIVFGITMANN